MVDFQRRRRFWAFALFTTSPFRLLLLYANKSNFEFQIFFPKHLLKMLMTQVMMMCLSPHLHCFWCRAPPSHRHEFEILSIMFFFQFFLHFVCKYRTLNLVILILKNWNKGKSYQLLLSDWYLFYRSLNLIWQCTAQGFTWCQLSPLAKSTDFLVKLH